VILSLWSLYSGDDIYFYSLAEMLELPQLLQNEETQGKLEELHDLVDEFERQVYRAVYSCKCCCSRRPVQLCCYKGIFGTLHQMGAMLEKNFSGQHFWIESHIGNAKIDSMFFPATSENILTGKNL
jgi:hypothetical protein